MNLLNVSSDRERKHLVVFIVKGFEGLVSLKCGQDLGQSVSTLGFGSWETLKEASWLVSGQESLSILLCALQENLNFWKHPRVGCWA